MNMDFPLVFHLSRCLGVTVAVYSRVILSGVDEDSSSSSLITDDNGIYGSGRYVIRQGVGGAGFGFDVGVVSRPYKGWQFGASIINLTGTLNWKQGGGNNASSLNPLTSFLSIYIEIVL